jgi:hypothetical protein
MFCPECKVEYRPGFTRCSDCEVDLVDVLPEEDVPCEEELTTLWECADQAECVGVCQDLRTADIPYHVDEIVSEKTTGMRVTFHYRILISRGDLERAKKLLGIDAEQKRIPSTDNEDEETVDPAAELADAGEPLAEDSVRRERYLDPWYPEDATVEVWSHEASERPSGIERALDANYIHCRCDSDESGGKKLFVRSEDEALAREIVRETVEGTPRK